MQARRVKPSKHKRLWLRWEHAYLELQHYVEVVGPVSSMSRDYATNDGFRLGAWVYTQQYAYANDFLSRGRAELLEKVHGWTWERREDSPARAASVLRQFAVPVDKTIGTPLYQQAANALRELIVAGHFVAGERFPSEKELVKHLGVGQDTIKMAVHRLRDEGACAFQEEPWRLCVRAE